MRAKLILLIAFAVVAAPVAYPGAAVANSTMALANCLGKPAVRPTSVILTCADGNFSVEKIQWTGWGEAFAAGTGTGKLNDCEPTCVAGHFHSYPMVVIASGRQTCPNGQKAYAKITYAFIGRPPANVPEDPTMPVPCHPMP